MTDTDQAAVSFGGSTPSGWSSEAHILNLPTMVSHLCWPNSSLKVLMEDDNSGIRGEKMA